MINGISNNSTMILQQAQSMQQRQKPPDLFQALDSDSSGGISQSELDTWAKNMSSETGNAIDTSKAFSSYDSDTDGALSSAELKSFLQSSGVKPPDGGPPPPPPTSNQTSENTTTSSLSTTSSDSIISGYDLNGDGMLSSSELQQFLDSVAQNSSSKDSSYLGQALSTYLTNMEQSNKTGSSSSYINNLNITIDFSA
jgi:Ca2+-binding EF-hand superfamily protein